MWAGSVSAVLQKAKKWQEQSVSEVAFIILCSSDIPMSTTAALSHSSPAWSYSPLSLSSLSPDNQKVPGSPQNSPLHSTSIIGLRPSPILFNTPGSSQAFDARVPEVASSLLRHVLDGNGDYIIVLLI